MVVVDANVLIFAVDADARNHEVAHGWLDGQLLRGASGVGLPWISLLAFLRIVTNPRILATPMSVTDAVDQVDAWLAAPAAVTVEPGHRHVAVLGELLTSARSGGNLVPDAHLAALAVEHNATVITYDGDFGRFPGVRHRKPAA